MYIDVKRQCKRLRKVIFAGVVALCGVGAAHAQPLIIPDTGGYDQLDGGGSSTSQKDLSGVFVDGNMFGFAWDETDLSGNNSSDTCTFFQAPDTTVHAVCYSVQFEPDGSITPGFPSFFVEHCVANNGSSTYGNSKCTGNNPTSSDYTASCDAPILVTSYFGAEDDDDDLQAKCTITGLGGNDAAELQLINTCTKPSASPSSVSSDCIFDPNEPDPGFLKLEKVIVDGTAVPTDFTLTATGPNTLTGDGSTVVTPVIAGDYTLTESSTLLDDNSYELVDIMCTTAGGVDVPVDSAGMFALPSLTEVTCVYSNQVAFTEAPDIAINKTPDTSTVEPGADVEFTLAVTVGTGNVAINNVVVTDNQCDSAPALQSGDNGDGVLDITETWIYTCTVSDINADFTNTATATGTSPGGTGVNASDTAAVSVLLNPSITVAKSSTTTELSAPGQLTAIW